MEVDGAGEWRPYSQRPEWADVAPVRLEGAPEVAAIQYSARHAEAAGYFRALRAAGETSRRALEVTGDMIAANAADYTAWQYRWLCAEALAESSPEVLQEEVALTCAIAADNAKNYQLWNHRRKLAAKLGAPNAPAELAFAAEALQEDEKNYHAWAHRQWVVKTFGLWPQELDYVQDMVAKDARNNSAWNQRAWLMRHAPAAAQQPLESLLQQELAYARPVILQAPRNEAPWAYVTGLFSLPRCTPYQMGRHQEVYALCCEVLERLGSCAPALDTLQAWFRCVACLALGRLAGEMGSSGDAGQAAADVLAVRDAALCSCDLLRSAIDVDPIRCGACCACWDQLACYQSAPYYRSASACCIHLLTAFHALACSLTLAPAGPATMCAS